jgi:hypothetical protein
MSERNRWLAAIIGGVVVIALITGVAITLQRGQEQEPPATPGHWPANERTAFINSCVDKCRASSGVTPAHYPLCDHACDCAADQAEKTLTIADLVTIYHGNATAEQKEKLKQVEAAGLACVAQDKK